MLQTSRSSLLFCLFALIGTGLHVQAALVSGPMIAHVDMREAKIWVQTEGPSSVRVAYSPVDESGDRRWSDPVETTAENAHCATLTLSGVEPGKRYRYRVEIGGELQSGANTFETPEFYHDRTPAPDLRIAVGGAHYATEDGYEPPYQILGGGYGIFSTILDSEPDLMLWLGNTAHLRESDWASRSGYLKRFTRARAVPELQPLLASLPHYATWSERDYAFTNSGQHYSYRNVAKESFETFWPRPVEVPFLDGIVTRFRRADVDFFLLDVRSYRNDMPTSTELPSILGTGQIEWLRQELVRSTARFKIVAAGAPVLNPAKSRSNLNFAEREQGRLLQALRDENIAGLVFLSGGKYYGELTRLVHSNTYNLFDLTVGPLTANPKANEDELNYFRMPGTSTNERHFALIDVTGPEEDRRLTFRVISMEGNERWNRSIKAGELQPPN